MVYTPTKKTGKKVFVSPSWFRPVSQQSHTPSITTTSNDDLQRELSKAKVRLRVECRCLGAVPLSLLSGGSHALVTGTSRRPGRCGIQL